MLPYSSSHNHRSGEWVPTRRASSRTGPFSTSMMGGRVDVLDFCFPLFGEDEPVLRSICFF